METRAHRRYRPLTKEAREIKDSLSNAKEPIQMRITASNTLWRALPKGRVPHVCIVGAGFAGLRCADVLSQRGLKVTILEGRDRIGGRVSGSEYLIRLPLTSIRSIKLINQVIYSICK